jgi:hypothetical protein
MVDTACYRRTKFVYYHKVAVEFRMIGNDIAQLIQFTSSGDET